MAYEVTKRIKGRDYRYRVEATRDPQTGRTRTRWHYLGRVVDGSVAPPSQRTGRATHESIIQATAALLESRDASRVTVSVIARQAGMSQATFYRYFADRRSAFAAALAYLADKTLEALPSLDGTPGTAGDEMLRFSEWTEALHRSLLRQRAFRWSYTSGDRSKAKARVERSLLKHDFRVILAAYFVRLHEAGVARIDDPTALVDSITSISLAFILCTANDEHDSDMRELRITDALPLMRRAIFGTSG